MRFDKHRGAFFGILRTTSENIDLSSGISYADLKALGARDFEHLGYEQLPHQ